ncbi:MAG: PHP domain-containing protein [Anaerolineae bacterium]
MHPKDPENRGNSESKRPILVCELHAHTLYSRDSLLSLDVFLAACRRKGLDRVAVTDHNTIAGALRLKEMDPERIIVGEEVRTTQGELIAYFLKKEIPVDLAPRQAIDVVHEQGGMVGVSHPLDRLRREAMGAETLITLLDQLDFLEVYNARCLIAADNRAARDLALQHGIPMTAGSDAHSLWELGRAVTLLPPFDSPSTFLDVLPQAEVRGQRSPPWIHFVSTMAKIRRRLRLARPLPES